MYLAAGGLLDVNPGLLIWTIITFSIVVIILRKFAWNPIINALDERAEKIHGDIEKAEQSRKESEKALAEYNQKLISAKDEAIAIVSEANADATRLKNKMLQETQEELKAIKENSLKEIELAKSKALQEVQSHIVELSIAVASQVLKKNLSANDHAAFIKDEISNIKSVK
jgi:F-type H+-transporting ATPase subunit b